MGWSLTSVVADSVAEVVNWIQTHEDMEILFITNIINLGSYTLQIAIALKAHKHQPWVVLDMGTSHLRPFFEEYYVRVEEGMIEHVIFHRWNSQIVREKASK